MSVAPGTWSRRAVVALAAGSLLLTAACSGRSEDSAGSDSGGGSDAPIVVGMSFPLSGPLAGAAAVADGAAA